MSELWNWIERIAGGLFALAILGVLIAYLPLLLRRLWRLLWRTVWRLPSTLATFRREPWVALQRWSDQSTLFTLLIFPPLWLLERLWPSAKRKAGERPAAAAAPSPTLELKALSGLADRRGELTVHGIWVLAEAVREFCDQHRYPLWRFVDENHDPSAIAAWHRELIATLAPWAPIRVQVDEFEAAWGPVARVYLSEDEWRCSSARLKRPFRHPWTLALNEAPASPAADAVTCQTLGLLDLLKTRHGVDALIDRLDAKCVAPYQAIDVPPLADESAGNRKLWTWANGESYPVALAWPDLSAFGNSRDTPAPVLIPRTWGSVEKSWGALGPLRLGADHTIIVGNAAGESGIVLLIDLRDALLGDVVGCWMQTCRWRYLSGGWPAAAGRGAVFEAAQSLAPNSHGEIVCDLIDGASGARINPDGVKILAGTLERDGCIAIDDDSEASRPKSSLKRPAKRVDWIKPAGELAHGAPQWTANDLRWAAIQADSEGYRPVQCASSGRWGFIDRDGAVAIAPQFAAVGHFHQSRARAWPAENPEMLGLIDTCGAWAIAPQWRRIDAQTRRCFVVQDAADAWGAVDDRGTVIVALRPRQLWTPDPDTQAPDSTDSPGVPDERADASLIELVAQHWHQRIRLSVKSALDTPPSSLAALENVFDSDARQRDLQQAGVWGIKVRVLRDQDETLLRPKAGEEGWLLSHYPVGLSCFDLSVEAPVYGLAVQPEAVIGVAWKNLAAVADSSHSAKA